MAGLRTSYPRFNREGGERAIILTDDDLKILHHVHRHRFVRADDLRRLLDHRSGDKLTRRLMWLFRAGYLDRPPAQIDRYGDPGSKSMVYGLGAAGGRALKERLGVRVGPTDWRARNRTYTRDNLDHTLATSEYLIDMELACRARPDVQLLQFDAILAAAPNSTRQTVQPGRWPVSVQWSLARAEVMLAPDAIFGLRVVRKDGAARSSFHFLEVDRGSMTIAPANRVQESEAFLYRATILRKLLAYAESYRLALHKSHLGLPTARVLFLTTSAARADSMQHCAEKAVIAPFGLPPGLFLFGVSSREATPLESFWVDSAGRGLQLAPTH